MRIAYICTDPGVPVFGTKGCAVHVQEVLRTLVARGDRVTLFASRLGGKRPAELDSLQVVPLARQGGNNGGRRSQLVPAANAALRAELRRAGPFDLVYERFALWSYAATELAQDAGWRSVLEVNAPLIDEEARHRVLIERELAESAARRAFAAADVVAAVSEEVAEWVRGRTSNRAEVRVIPNGVCPCRITPRVPPRDAELAAQFTVGFVGSLRPWHGLEQLVDAFVLIGKRFADARLLIVGDGPRREGLLQRLGGLPGEIADRVHWVGAVPVAEVPAWLTTMRVAVAPYPAGVEFYFSPLKVFEYMAAGRAVVASDAGQLKSILQHGRNGLLIPAGDARSLADALVALHDQPALATRLGAEARRSVVENHTWEQVVRRVMHAGTFKRGKVAVAT